MQPQTPLSPYGISCGLFLFFVFWQLTANDHHKSGKVHGDTIAYSAVAILVEKMEEYQSLLNKAWLTEQKGEQPTVDTVRKVAMAWAEVEAARARHDEVKSWALRPQRKSHKPTASCFVTDPLSEKPPELKP